MSGIIRSLQDGASQSNDVGGGGGGGGVAAKQQSTKFKVKLIQWSDYDHESPILLQDGNGPCPLIALVNTLLLKYEVEYRNHQLNSDHTVNERKTNLKNNQTKIFDSVGNLKALLMKNVNGHVKIARLLSELGDILLSFNEIDDPDDHTGLPLDELLDSLPLLHTGLSVNPNILTGDFPFEDLATVLFKKFHLIFKHGWCLDQVNDSTFDGDYGRLVDILSNLQTFDKIQDFLLKDDISDDDKRLVSKWLDTNRTQLTSNGLKKLDFNLPDDTFIVFFRNNHFMTLYKRTENDFYCLVTDSSFGNKKIVWQSLISVSGIDDLFFTGDFIPVFGDDTFDVMKEDDIERNDLLLKQLQEEEDQEIAKQLQQNYNKKGSSDAPLASTAAKSKTNTATSTKSKWKPLRRLTSPNSGKNKATDNKATDNKATDKKSKCIIM